jgi:hypothetical protein
LGRQALCKKDVSLIKGKQDLPGLLEDKIKTELFKKDQK